MTKNRLTQRICAAGVALLAATTALSVGEVANAASARPRVTITTPVSGSTVEAASQSVTYTVNRTPKQIASVSCAFNGSPVNCAKPAASGKKAAAGSFPVTAAVGSNTATVTIRLTDGGTGSATTTFTFTAPNSPPVAVDDKVLVRVGQVVVANVLDNDSDADEDPLQVTEVRGTLPPGTSVSESGALVVDTSGSTPTGTWVLAYDVSDGTTTSSAEITIEVWLYPHIRDVCLAYGATSYTEKVPTPGVAEIIASCTGPQPLDLRNFGIALAGAHLLDRPAGFSSFESMNQTDDTWTMTIHTQVF